MTTAGSPPAMRRVPVREERRSWRVAVTLAVFAVLSWHDVRAFDPGAPEPQCLHSAGKTACGYGCRASDNQVRCAQTPQGICHVGSGIVACWDPPPLVKAVLGRNAPRPSCVTSYGQTACGYHCIANYDQVQCAQTPFGACRANEGNVACWDPPAAVLASRKATTPRAACESGYGKVGCGYHCIADHGVVRCAETPDGTCRSERDTVFCWDPPLEATGAVWNAASELACIQASNDRSCGFRCLAIPNQGRCGSTRVDSCRVKEENIVCVDPTRDSAPGEHEQK